MNRRYLYKNIIEDLKQKMVFISGPRQVGKTTLIQNIGEQFYKHTQYLNWDNRDHRKMILNTEFIGEPDLVIFDEIHKYKKWKNHIKGFFDTFKNKYHIAVTGSARLDLYKKGGDSLMGRYYNYRLHPITLAEALDIQNKVTPFEKLTFHTIKDSSKILQELMEFGGFPEPFLSKNKKTLRRWQNNRLDRLVEEDIRDVEIVRDLSALQILSDILPNKVGSLFSINSLVSDLEVTHKTVSRWVDVLERFYYHYRIYPYTASKKINYIKKEPKLFLWDYSTIQDNGNKFENLIASHLLKFVHFLEDSEGYKAELRFIRDKEEREADLLVVVDKKPWFVVEVKMSDTKVSKPLNYFRKKLDIPFSYQVVNKEGVDMIKDGVRVISASKFLTAFI